MSSQPLLCCCLRVPVLAGLQWAKPAALGAWPTARGWARVLVPMVPTVQLRREQHPLLPLPPRMPCRASARLSCSCGPACSPSSVATTGRYWARMNRVHVSLDIYPYARSPRPCLTSEL